MKSRKSSTVEAGDECIVGRFLDRLLSPLLFVEDELGGDSSHVLFASPSTALSRLITAKRDDEESGVTPVFDLNVANRGSTTGSNARELAANRYFEIESIFSYLIFQNLVH